MVTIGSARGQFARFSWKIITDWSFSLSALIAYYLLISVLPLMLSIFAVVTLIFGDHDRFQQLIRDRLIKAFPEQALAEVVDTLLNSLSQQAGLVFGISFAVALFTGSRLFIGLDDVLTIIYRIRERQILEQNILALKMILGFVFIMPFIIIFFSISIFVERNEWIYRSLSTILGALFTYGFFQLNYLILPKRRMLLKNTWFGSLIATIGLQFFLRLFPIYVREFMADYVGQMGFIIITLLLFYTFGFVFVLGAQINAFFFDRIPELSEGIGTCLSLFANQDEIQLFDDRNSSARPSDLQRSEDVKP